MKVKNTQSCLTLCNPMGLWNSAGQNSGVGSLSLLQGIFPTKELNQDLLHCRWILYQLSYQGSPLCEWVRYKEWPKLNASSPKSALTLDFQPHHHSPCHPGVSPWSQSSFPLLSAPPASQQTHVASNMPLTVTTSPFLTDLLV